MKKTEILTESDITRLVKKIINESVFPSSLVRLFRSMDDVVKSKVFQETDQLLKTKQIDNIVVINGKKGTIKNGEQLLYNFIQGNLKSKDSQKVFDIILKHTEDKALIDSMTDFLSDQMNFFLKYNGKTRDQIIADLAPKFGENKAKILADKVTLKSIAKNKWPTFWKMWFEAWKSPKLHQMAFRIIRKASDKTAWGNMMRWFITGTSRNIGRTFKDYMKLYEGFGFSKSVVFALARLTASIGLEAFQRWLTVNAVVTAMNLFAEWYLYSGTPKANQKLEMADWEVAWDVFYRNWPNTDFWWLIPAFEVLPAIYRLILGGPVRGMTPQQLYDYVINKQYPWYREMTSFDDQYSDDILFIRA
jgi:hypothetical protein